MFRESEPLFGGRTNQFSEAFPYIEDIEITVTELKYGHEQRKATYTESSFPGEFFDCSNPLCYNGGIQIGQFVRSMTYDRQETMEEDWISCRGYEGSPNGRRKYGPCSHSFKLKVRITYKPTT